MKVGEHFTVVSRYDWNLNQAQKSEKPRVQLLGWVLVVRPPPRGDRHFSRVGGTSRTLTKTIGTLTRPKKVKTPGYNFFLSKTLVLQKKKLYPPKIENSETGLCVFRGPRHHPNP